MAMHPRRNFIDALDPHNGTQPFIIRVPDHEAIDFNKDSDSREEAFGRHWFYEYRRFRALYTYNCKWKARDVDNVYAKLRKEEV